jgi:uncharacterized membrane protein YdjX (TVP38/TMEM64 family)
MGRLPDRLRRLRHGVHEARAAIARLALFGLALLALFAGLHLAGVNVSVGTVKRWGDDLGTAGLIAFVPAAIVLNCVFVLPIPIAAGGAGLLFGTAAGTVLTVLVAGASAGIQNAIGRRGAGARAEQLLGERGRRFDDLLDRRGFTAVLYARLTPFTPFTSLNYASGITKLGAWPMAIASGLAMAPRMYAYTALGGSLDDLTSHESISAFVVLVASTALGIGLITHAGLRHRRSRPEPGAA